MFLDKEVKVRTLILLLGDMWFLITLRTTAFMEVHGSKHSHVVFNWVSSLFGEDGGESNYTEINSQALVVAQMYADCSHLLKVYKLVERHLSNLQIR